MPKITTNLAVLPMRPKYTPEDVEWMAKARCLGMDPSLFFPHENDSPESEQAKDVCKRCPVRQECLEFAIKNHENYGIWGGLTEMERRREIRLRRMKRLNPGFQPSPGRKKTATATS